MRYSTAVDSSDMLGKVTSLPAQLGAGFELGNRAWMHLKGIRPRVFVVAGMGASAIGGDLLRRYLARRSGIPFLVSREHALPASVGEGSLVVVSSYSGNTSEALSSLADALKKRAGVACISSGGQLAEEARRLSIPHLAIPSGYPPRAGLGYSFGALLSLAWQVGLCDDPTAEIAECVRRLETLSAIYSLPESEDNSAARLAGELGSSLPVIYCGSELDGVGLRWRNQFCENSKRLAFVSFLPEASHNEVMGWEASRVGIEAGVIVLRTPDEHPEVSRLLCLTREVVAGRARFCGEFWADGPSLLCRTFSLILLGDYASVYLAVASGLDPTPITTIDMLKCSLKQERAEE